MASVAAWYRAEVESLSVLDFDDLFVRLAESAMRAVGSLDDERKRQLGQAWFDAQLAGLRESLCLHPSVATLRTSALSSVEVAVALTDVLTWARGDYPIAILAVLISKYDLSRLCDSAGSTPPWHVRSQHLN